MILFNKVAVAILITLSVAKADVVFADSAPPQRQLKTYALPDSTQSADISPDEQSVVVITRKLDGANSQTKTILDAIQLWSFKEGKLRAEFTPRQPEVPEARVYPKDYLLDSPRTKPIVRFSPGGNEVVALIGRTIHILLSTNLTEVRAFPLVVPDNVTRTSPRGRTVVHEPVVRAMEISPIGEVVAVLWVKEMLHGRIQLYDLSTGRSALSWDTPQGWTNFTRGLAWRPDGKSLLIAIPNMIPCGSPSTQPDVFVFDAQTGGIEDKFTTGLLPGSIAVSSDNRVLAVDFNCLGVFKNHSPELRVFDLTTGKRLKSIRARETGVRYSVSSSADGNRFLAFTGKMKIKYDWSDLLPYDVVVDETFSVWTFASYEGIVTSQNIPGLKASELRLSSKGSYAFSYGKASFVYELP